jgi:hypothetical protein
LKRKKKLRGNVQPREKYLSTSPKRKSTKYDVAYNLSSPDNLEESPNLWILVEDNNQYNQIVTVI